MRKLHLGIGSLLCLAALLFAGTARGQSFSISSSPGSGVNGTNVMGQNFSPSVNGISALPSPVPASGATVYLTSWQFTDEDTFGAPDAGSLNTFLVIENGAYPNFTGLTASTVTGISTNSVDTTTDVTAGAALTWNFNDLPLVYGNNYTAAMATVGAGGALTFIGADIQLVHFTQDLTSSTYYPDANYGGGQTISNESASDNYNAAALYTFGGGFFGAGSDAEDSVFTANFVSSVPEPATLAMVGLLGLALVSRRRAPVH